MNQKGFVNIAVVVPLIVIAIVTGYVVLVRKTHEAAQTTFTPTFSSETAPHASSQDTPPAIPHITPGTDQKGTPRFATPVPASGSSKNIKTYSPFFPFLPKETPASSRVSINSIVLPVHPSVCAPQHGFDGYRTDETFVINPKNNREMYVNIEFKGIYKSIDAGKTWQFSGNGMEAWPRADDPSKPCYMEYMSMYIDPKNPQRILLPGGAAPGRVSDPMYRPGGLHESLDGGKNWHQLFSGNMNAYTIHTLVDPRNHQIIYVTTSALPSSNNEAHQNIIFVKEGVVYKSIDGGKNWRELPTGFVPHTRVTSIFINNENSDHLMIGTSAIPPNAGGGKVLEDQMGILETKDGGETWHTLQNLTADYRAIHSMDATQNLAHLFVYTQHSNDNENVFYSLDGGVTFNEVPRPVNMARFDPYDPSGMHLLGFSIYAQPNDFFESMDGGRSWNAIGMLPSQVTNDSRASNIIFDPSDRNTIYINGSYGRIWKSTNKGKIWQLLLDVDMLGE